MRSSPRGCVALVLLVSAACTRAPVRPDAVPGATPTSPSPSPVSSPSPSPRQAVYEAERALEHIRILAQQIGVREVSKPGYRRAADYVAEQFGAAGYRVVRQTVAIPAGSSEGVPVPATKADNVLAYPQNFDPSRPHLVAGAHLDTVAVSPGANDNATGVATILELARLASLESTRLPVVWVALAGEERRFRPDGALFGARHYLNSLSAPERASLRGMFNVDMVGNGPIVLVCSRGTGKRGFLDHTIASARRLKVPVREQVVTRFFSDSGPFEGAGVPVSWLWAGEHPSVHTPQDVLGVIRIADLERFGRVGWEALRTFRG